MDIVNEKSAIIVNQTIKTTKRADAERIKEEMGAYLSPVIGKRGKELKKKKLSLLNALQPYWNQLAVLLVIARLRKANKPIPAASELKELAIKLVSARLKSIGFVASGWLASLRGLARVIKNRPTNTVSLPKQFGGPKGSVQRSY